MLGICTVFLIFKSVDYAIVFAMTPLVINKTISFFGFDFSVISIITFLLF
jgi:NADH-quinone oxidoreductase subunit L